MIKATTVLALTCLSLNLSAAELPTAAAPASPLANAWTSIDGWVKSQTELAGERLVSKQGRFVPPHLRNQNLLGRYAETEMVLLPQRHVGHGLDHSLAAGSFTVTKTSDVAFADRSEAPDSAVGVVIEYAGELAFAGHLPETNGTDGVLDKQARHLGELVTRVAPGRPTKITLVSLNAADGSQLSKVRSTLGGLYAGVPVEVLPNWP